MHCKGLSRHCYAVRIVTHKRMFVSENNSLSKFFVLLCYKHGMDVLANTIKFEQEWD